MSEERFMQLVKDNNGFEFIQAYRDDEDHFLGGKDSTYWYMIMKKGKIRETYIGTYTDGAWKDVYVKGSGEKKKTKEMPEGTAIRRISEKAYLAQNESWVTRKTPPVIEDSHPHRHYVYGFGDRGLDISAQYGVTIGYSDLKDVPAGFHLRDIRTGKDVEKPE